MDAGPFDMLHDSRDQNFLAVADRIHLNLFSAEILVHQDRMVLGDPVDDADELINIVVVDGDLHALATQHVGGSYQDRITQTVRHLLGLLGGEYGSARRTGDLTFLQDLVEEFPVLRLVHIFRGGSQNWNSHLHQAFRQLDGGLSAELHHRAVGLFQIHDALHILRGQGFKIELVRNVKICADGLRIVVHDDGFITFPGKCPGTVHGAEVKLNPLADPDGAGAENQNLFSSLCLFCLVFTAENRVVVGCFRGKFRGAGVHHLIGGHNAVCMAHIVDLPLRSPGEPGDHGIRKFHPLRFL